MATHHAQTTVIDSTAQPVPLRMHLAPTSLVTRIVPFSTVITDFSLS